MKRIIGLFFAAIMIFALAACTANTDLLYEKPVKFYYRRAEVAYQDPAGVIMAETREAAPFAGDAKLLLQSYLNGPNSEELSSPFPAGTKLTELNITEACAHLELDIPGTELKGIDLTVAYACIAKTCLGITDARSVEILITGSSAPITMDADTILLLDSVAVEESD